MTVKEDAIGLISAMNSNPLFLLYQYPYFSFLSVADFSCSWSWIRWFVLFLVKYFDMPIWHPTSEKALDELLDAKVDV